MQEFETSHDAQNAILFDLDLCLVLNHDDHHHITTTTSMIMMTLTTVVNDDHPQQ
jgi:hypothetical protein